MDFIDSKYIGLVSSRLEKFKKVNANTYTFRCPICGDSKKNRNKTRGYFYAVKNNTNFKCHNCGASFSLNNFLKTFDTVLYQEYIFEKFKGGHTGKGFVVDTPKFDFNKPVFRDKIDLPRASDVPEADQYLKNRKVDPSQFYYAHEFKKWINKQKKTFDNTSKDEKRIVIPLYDFNKNIIGYQGRSLEASPNKYITVMLIEDAPKIYGLDKVNPLKTVYIVEGPFDSTFIDNSVAMCGSDVDLSDFKWKDYVYVYDNEPRNHEIVKRISKTIDQGNKVVIWDSHINQKDINDMILSGLNVQEMLETSTYQGLEAKLKFTTWKKV